MGVFIVVWLLWLMIAANYPGLGLCIAAALFIGIIYLVWKATNTVADTTRLAVNNEEDARRQLKRTYDKNFPEMTEKQKWVCIDKFIEECYKDGTFPKEWSEL